MSHFCLIQAWRWRVSAGLAPKPKLRLTPPARNLECGQAVRAGVGWQQITRKTVNRGVVELAMASTH